MEYLLKSSAIILIFYLFYKIFLKNDTYFKTIRWFFLAGLVLSLTLPLVTFTKYIEVVPQVTNTSFMISESSDINNSDTNEGIFFNLYKTLTYIYVLGIIVFILQFLVQLGSLALLLIRHPIKKENGYLLVETSEAMSPFSFFNYIVYNPDHFNDDELKQITTHEKVHVRYFHSVDSLIVQLFSIFQWFNPFIWLYRKEIQQNLEFITDEITEQRLPCKKSYQRLLLKTSAPNYKLALVNNFYNSLLKNRIHMLHKERSTNYKQLKLIFMAPVLLTFLMAFNTKSIAQTTDDDKEVIEIKSEIMALLISNKTSKEGLEKLKDKFAEKGLKVSFSGIKRNKENEITAIKIDAKATNGKAAAAYAVDDDKAIKPIKISFDTDNNNLSIGSAHQSRHAYRFRTGGEKKVIIRKGSKDNDEDVIHIETDGDHDGDSNVHVWTSKDGDLKKMKRSKEVIVEIDDDGKEMKKEIIKIRRSGSSEDDEFLFIDSDDDANTQTTYIVNGKKMTKEAFKKMDKKDIKTIEIKKERKNKN